MAYFFLKILYYLNNKVMKSSEYKNTSNSKSIKHFIKHYKNLGHKSENNINTNELKDKLKNIDYTKNYKYKPLLKSNQHIYKYLNNFHNYIKNLKLKSLIFGNKKLTIEELYYLYKKNLIQYGFTEYLIQKEYNKLLKISDILITDGINVKSHNIFSKNIKNISILNSHYKYIINGLCNIVKDEININTNINIKKFVNYNFDYILSLFLIEYKDIFIKEIFYCFHTYIITCNYIYSNKNNIKDESHKKHIFKDYINTFHDVFFNIFNQKYNSFIFLKYDINTNNIIKKNSYLKIMYNYLYNNVDKTNNEYISYFLSKFVKYVFYFIFIFIYFNKKNRFNESYGNKYDNKTINDDVKYMFEMFINYPNNR